MPNTLLDAFETWRMFWIELSDVLLTFLAKLLNQLTK